MTNLPWRKVEHSALLAILLLPLLFAGLGIWEVWRGIETLAEVQAGRLRLVPAGITVLGGLAAAGAGLAGMGLANVSARQGARSRAALVVSFGRVRRLLPLLLAVQVIGLAASMLGASVFEASGLWFTPDADDRAGLLAFLGLVYAGLALWGCFETLRDLRRALRLFAPGPMPLAAVAVGEAEAPGLFALLRGLAQERGTTVPDTVVLGAEAGFFVTALPTHLVGGPGQAPGPVDGRILHLPLAGLAALDQVELRTVLAHELAHFSGEDTQYSLRFQPLYTGLGQGAAAMSVRRVDWGGTLPDRLMERVVHPHTALAVHAYQRFDHVVAQWSRQRELEADRAAMESGSPGALASSLLRLGLVTELNRRMLRGIAEVPDAAPENLAAEVVALLGTAEAGDPADHLGDRAPHPTDTHPPTRQRIEAAGVAIDGTLMARAARPVGAAELAAAQALFVDWPALSRRIGGDLADRARDRIAVRREYLLSVAQEAAEGVTVLLASLLRPALVLVLFGSFCLAVAAGCILAALYGGEQDRQAWRFLAGVAAAGAAGLGFTVLWGVRLWRGRRVPMMVLSSEGVESPGFTGTLRWLDVRAIAVSGAQAQTVFLLDPEARLPPRTGRIRRLQHDAGQHAVTFTGMLPRGLSAAALQALLLRYAQAAHARDSLGERLPLPGSGSA